MLKFFRKRRDKKGVNMLSDIEMKKQGIPKSTITKRAKKKLKSSGKEIAKKGITYGRIAAKSKAPK